MPLSRRKQGFDSPWANQSGLGNPQVHPFPHPAFIDVARALWPRDRAEFGFLSPLTASTGALSKLLPTPPNEGSTRLPTPQFPQFRQANINAHVWRFVYSEGMWKNCAYRVIFDLDDGSIDHLARAAQSYTYRQAGCLVCSSFSASERNAESR